MNRSAPVGLLRVLLMLALCAVAVPGWAQSLRVMTFNVRLPVAADGENRWEARRTLMAATIHRYRPDLFGTQELHKPSACWPGTSAPCPASR